MFGSDVDVAVTVNTLASAATAAANVINELSGPPRVFIFLSAPLPLYIASHFPHFMLCFQLCTPCWLCRCVCWVSLACVEFLPRLVGFLFLLSFFGGLSARCCCRPWTLGLHIGCCCFVLSLARSLSLPELALFYASHSLADTLHCFVDIVCSSVQW